MNEVFELYELYDNISFMADYILKIFDEMLTHSEFLLRITLIVQNHKNLITRVTANFAKVGKICTNVIVN